VEEEGGRRREEKEKKNKKRWNAFHCFFCMLRFGRKYIVQFKHYFFMVHTQIILRIKVVAVQYIHVGVSLEEKQRTVKKYFLLPEVRLVFRLEYVGNSRGTLNILMHKRGQWLTEWLAHSLEARLPVHPSIR
jgi:hypothetical protein